MKPLKLVFMGSDIALDFLEDLWNDSQLSDLCTLQAVVTQPDRRKGRGMKLVPNPLKEWAQQNGIPVFQPRKFGPEETEWLRNLSCDAVIVMSYGHILKQDALDTPRLGMFNLHASILPSLRGASPIQGALAAGMSQTGVTFMRMVQQLDAGPMADMEVVEIDKHDAVLSLTRKLRAACVPLMRRVLPALAADQLEWQEQDESCATFTRLIRKDDAAIDFNMPARDIYNRFRALQPWPGSSFTLRDLTIKIGDMDFANNPGADDGPPTISSDHSALAHTEPGTVLGAHNEQGLAVSTGKGVVYFKVMQRSGGKMLPAEAFLRGCPIEPGTHLSGTQAIPLWGHGPYSANRGTFR